MQKISIILADHHPIVRKGLSALFSDQTDMDVVAECGCTSMTLTLLKKYRPDVLLLEMAMPDCSVKEVVQYIQRHALPTVVLVISTHKEEQHAVPSLQAGARGFINKSHSTQDILHGTRQIAAGGNFISPELAQKMAIESLNKSDPTHSLQPLSHREQEVLIELASGRSASAVAKRLHLSPKTVSTHKTRICQKLGIRNSFDLMRYILEQGLS